MQGKPKQLGIFDIPRPAQPPQEPQKNNDPALLNFLEDIDGKNSKLELNQWSYKHRQRIRALSTKQRGIVINYMNSKMEILRLKCTPPYANTA